MLFLFSCVYYTIFRRISQEIFDFSGNFLVFAEVNVVRCLLSGHYRYTYHRKTILRYKPFFLMKPFLGFFLCFFFCLISLVIIYLYYTILFSKNQAFLKIYFILAVIPSASEGSNFPEP